MAKCSVENPGEAFINMFQEAAQDVAKAAA
jgi:hypothetical protein